MIDKNLLETSKLLLQRFSEGINTEDIQCVNSIIALIISDVLGNIGNRLVSENYRGKDLKLSQIYLVAAQELRKLRAHLLKLHKENELKEKWSDN